MGLESGEENYVVGSKRGWALVKYSGTYDLKALTDAIRNYWMSHYYLINDKEHSEKVSSAGKEIKFDMEAFRGISLYLRFFVQVEVVIYRNVDVLVEKEGKKVKMQQGDMEVRFKAHLKKNYKGTFKSGGFQKFLRHIYERFIIPNSLRKYRFKLQKETEALMDEVKNVLAINQRE